MRQPLFFISLLLVGLSARAQDSDPFQGAYANEQYGIGLWLKKEAVGYSGQFLFREKIYVLTALKIGNTLAGEYTYGDNKIGFSLSRNEDRYTLTSEGVELPMVLKDRNETTYTYKPRTPEPVKEPAPAKTGGKGSPFNDPNGQFRFTVPENWTISEQEGNYFLTNSALALPIIISRHNEQQIDQSVASVGDINDEASKTFVKMKARKLDDHTAYTKGEGTVQQQPFLIEILTLFSPYGGGISLIVSYNNQPYTQDYLQVMQQIASSVQFSKTTLSGAALQWQERVKGKKLLYLFTDNYGSQRVDIDLYVNGTFSYNNNNGMMSSGGVGTGTYAGEDRFTGSWKLDTNGSTVVLILTGNTGRSLQFTLQDGTSSTQILLNNKRYFIQSLQ